ncbi:MBL fold metallo-hydrolase [Marichromatium gracile]|uniref:7, 8-dihydropterin-6-yl-methyl-4-(Beta-D-ribofuranosyl)aminobenzene 5'-phosphate synthase n=1 Tax=Marichromatium gracile TaxID=1048 RepID=A0A4R4AKB8_MARGR|nr:MULTISPECIES: MBL fold metallo-hydrolase [Marichromatium]MBK1707498.1 metal-dependent hydrolase [Marichromatium gracile]MCF1182345.1 MBL fold metallo-hydrolase [Marichromatium gracile]RNE94108.1 MBL fold metallo-hydrolase [Marichromatium sp. AB32]TCW39851.1 7,8-dihydropterin-6-yl-methyl-4-(beta-D-ribofuranosyl)aminobenzene 5'-phosphate synthase [Marichromatium gracile]
MKPSDLTILFDNHDPAGGPRTLWGFAALVRVNGQRLLFDTGSNGPALLRGMRAQGVDPATLDQVFLSHQHWDHIGGLDAVLDANPGVSCVLHDGFSAHLVEDIDGLCGELIVVGAEPRELAPGVSSTGRLEGPPDEQALVIDTGAGIALVSGCAHPGIETLVARARALADAPVRWVIGGLHLMRAESVEIAATVTALRDLGVEWVLPTHCTGAAGVAACQRLYGGHALGGGIGARVDFAALGATAQR